MQQRLSLPSRACSLFRRGPFDLFTLGSSELGRYRHPPPTRVWGGLGAISVLSLLSYPSPMAWLGVGGLVGLALARWRLLGRPFAGSPFAAPFLLYVGGALLGLRISVHPQPAEARFFGLLAALASFFLVVDLAASPRAARRVAYCVLLGVLLALPLLLTLSIPSLSTDRLPGPRFDWLGFPGPWSEPLRTALQDHNLFELYRFSAAGLGTLAVFGVGLAAGPLLAGPGRSWRLFGALAAGYCGLFALMSTNRAAVLVGGLVIVLLGARQSRRILAAAVIAAGVVALALLVRSGSGGPMAHALRSLPSSATDPMSAYVRFEYWQNALLLLHDFHFTGVGLGQASVRALYGQYFLSGKPITVSSFPVLDDDFHFPHAHNIFMQSYLEQGLLGLAGLVGLVAVGVVVSRRAFARARESAVRSTVISASGASLALILSGLTEIVVLTPLGMVMLFGSLGMLVGAARLSEPIGHPARRHLWKGRPTAVALSMAVVLAALLIMTTVPAVAQGRPPPSILSHPGQVPHVLAAAFYLNLGALELARLTLSNQLPPREHQRRIETAQHWLNLALERDPGNLGVYRNLAAAALARSDRAEALRLLAEAEARAAPDDSHFFFQAGRLYREAADVERAVAAWTRVDPAFGARSGAGPRVHLLLWGTELANRGSWPAAVQVNQAAIRALPTHPAPYRALAKAISRTDGDEAALMAMRELAHAYADIPWAYEEAAKLAAQVRLREEAGQWNQLAGAIRASEAWKIRQRQAGR
jgi:O-antigen ligase